MYVAVLTFNATYLFRSEFPKPRRGIPFHLAQFIHLIPDYIRVVAVRAVDWIGKEAQLQRYSYIIEFPRIMGA